MVSKKKKKRWARGKAIKVELLTRKGFFDASSFMPEKVLPFRSKYIIEGTAKDRGMEKNSKLLNFESISFGNFFLKIDAKPFINISSR